MDNRGEVLFLANCMDKNLCVSRPFTTSRYDFIVDNGMALAKIQVKSAHKWKASTKDIWLVNASTFRGRKNQEAYTPKDIDFLAFHLIEIGAWYIIPADMIEGRKSFYLYPMDGKGMWEQFRERWGLLTTFLPATSPR
jgi:hypothetical protein